MKNCSLLHIGIFAPSAPVPVQELKASLERLNAEKDIRIYVHPQTLQKHTLFAGTDEARARALLELALDPQIDVIWAGRGGYGVSRMLPHLDRLSRGKRIPRKTLIGFSDVTILHHYVQTNWKWKSIHAPMPGGPAVSQMKEPLFQKILAHARGEQVSTQFKLRPLGISPKHTLRAQVVGGNLCVITNLIGTKYQPNYSGKILFLEEVDEAWYRIDRMIEQARSAGIFKGVKGIVLGTFQSCEDKPSKCWGPVENGERTTQLLRKPMSLKQCFELTFGELSRDLKIPLAQGLPCGHGPLGHTPLPLGETWEWSKNGLLRLAKR